VEQGGLMALFSVLSLVSFPAVLTAGEKSKSTGGLDVVHHVDDVARRLINKSGSEDDRQRVGARCRTTASGSSWPTSTSPATESCSVCGIIRPGLLLSPWPPGTSR
jgi:hypothetical protein